MTPVEALQKTLAAEHAAVHLYGVLGGQASKSQNPALFRQLDEAYDEHRTSRDRLTVLINAKGKAPVAALVDYAVPGPTSTPSQIEAVARTIERRVTTTYGELVDLLPGQKVRLSQSVRHVPVAGKVTTKYVENVAEGVDCQLRVPVMGEAGRPGVAAAAECGRRGRDIDRSTRAQ